MAIEVVPAQLFALAGVLDAAAGSAARVGTAVEADPVGGALGGAVAAFDETTRTWAAAWPASSTGSAGPWPPPRTRGWGSRVAAGGGRPGRPRVTVTLPTPVPLPEPAGSAAALGVVVDQLTSAGWAAGLTAHLLEPAGVLRLAGRRRRGGRRRGRHDAGRRRRPARRAHAGRARLADHHELWLTVEARVRQLRDDQRDRFAAAAPGWRC